MNSASASDVHSCGPLPTTTISASAPSRRIEIADRLIDSVADRLAIDAALAELPEEFRAAVVLRDVGDLDYAEIAEVLELPIGTVKSRIARGRRLLIEKLGNRDTPEERHTNETRTEP